MDARSRSNLPPIFWTQGLTTRTVLSRALFVLLLGLFLTSSLICTVAAIGWVNRPFPGFIVLENMRVDRPGPPHWTGANAGLRFPDLILAVNGQPVTSVKELVETVEGLPVGTPVNYTIRRVDNIIEVRIPTMTFTWLDATLKFGVMFGVGVSLLVLGVLVFVLKPDTEVSWAFFLGGFLLALDFINVFDYEPDPFGFVRWIRVLVMFFPATVIHLSSVFPRKPEWLRRHRLLTAVPYLISFSLAGAMEGFYRDGPAFETLHHIYFLYLGFSAFALLTSIAASLWSSSSTLARARAKALLLGASLALPIPAGTAILRSHGVWLGGVPVAFTVSPLLIFPATIAYAIVKHNLFDLDIYIKRTMGYAIMTGVVALAYFLVQTVVSTLVLKPVFGAQAENLYPIVFALLVVFFFNPINQLVQEGVEKLFFRKAYDYKAMVASVGDALTSLVDLNAIITKVIYSIRAQMFVDAAGVILLDPDKRECRSIFFTDPSPDASGPRRDPCLSRDDALLTLLAQEKTLVTKYDIAEDPRYEPIRESCGKAFSKLGASLAFPLLYQDTFAGMLAVGYKKSGHFYSRDDIDLLKTFSTMTATAIEQSREKGQRAVLMQLFSKHVSPEVADSLWNQREQFLDGGRPRSQSLIVTAMFTDLQGFSTISEKMDPQALMDWLNLYMEMVTKTVMDHGGVVDDFFGDGVKVNFGVPVPRTTEASIRQDAVNAVTCALALEQELVALNGRMRAGGTPPLRMRIGIHTGPVVAGSLGSADRLKYTTLGDTVNTAARLESYDKDLVLPHLVNSPCRILIGESTFQYLGPEFETQKVGELTLKGKETKISVHCVLGQRAEVGSCPEVPAPQV